MTIHEYIKQQVNECVSEIKEANLYNSLRPIIAESLMEAGKEAKKSGKKKVKVDTLVKKLMKNKEFKKKAMEYLTDKDVYDGWSNALDGKTYNKLDNMSNGAMRREVTQQLEDEKINNGPIFKDLWPNMTYDAARSWGSKKLHGKGGARFTDEEVAAIYQDLNNKMTE